MNIQALDLNLLLVFDSLMEERNVTRAAARVGLSQPAMSHALRRLRDTIGDELFVRGATGMIPTPRAEQLAFPLRQVLNDIRSALEPETFDPATSTWRFVIAVNNYASFVIAAPLVAAVAAAAPNIELDLRPSVTLDVPELIDRGELDLNIGAQQPNGERFAGARLIEDSFVVAFRRDHPLARVTITPRSFAQFPGLEISSSGDDLSFIVRELEATGLAERTACRAPYLAATDILLQSDMITTLTSRVAVRFEQAASLEFRPLPFHTPKVYTGMMWHRRLQSQPAHRWLRDMVQDVAAKL